MKHKISACFATLCLSAPVALLAVDAAYKPLWLYQGTWSATAVHAGEQSKTDTLINDCAMAGRFFSCQQTVNGKPGALIIFVPAAKPGDYYTQAVMQEGWATGRGELHIEGDNWTYMGKTDENGKTIYHRTTNVFSGKDRIHYELSESEDGKTWKVMGTGDEVRKSRKGSKK